VEAIGAHFETGLNPIATASDDVPAVRRLIYFIDRECIER
jgi:hypothetical protein